MHLLAVLGLFTISATLDLTVAQVLLNLRQRNSTLDLAPRDNPTEPTTCLQWLDDVVEYTAEVKIGTPGQTMTVRIEFETFFTNTTLIPSTNSTSCENTTDIHDGCHFGSFNQNVSSTFYIDSIYAREGEPWAGVMFTDTLEFGGISGLHYSMDLLYDVAPPPSHIAVFTGNTPAIDNTEPSLPFLYLLGDLDNYDNNIVDLMVTGGHIPTPAFSLWLQDGHDFTGGLLFGAIDTNRYEGDLVSLDTYDRDSLEVQPARPQQTPNDAEIRGPVISIAMTSLSASSPTGTDDIWVQGPLLVRIKLGDDLWLSPYLAAQMRNITGAFVRLDDTGAYEYTVIPCSMRYSLGYFTFGFGGPEGFKVNVTMGSLVVPPPRTLRNLFDSFGKDMCRFGISETKGYDVGFLSSHLLRSVYTVVDLYNNKVAMAPIKLNNTCNGSNIVTFDGNGASIPSATSAPDQPSSVSRIAWSGPSQPPSFRAAEGFGQLTIATTAPSSKANSNPGGHIGDIGVNVGIITSVSVIFLVIFTLVIRKRRKATRDLANREEPELQENPIEITRVQQTYSIYGNIYPAELPGVREPSELHGTELYPELPGDYQFPEKADVEAMVEKEHF
ncbi:acid protease [Annulohypoxylon bovei var. microspora]|nr:acid protease [Annulohypoxylon bovei var. microspora]